MSNECKTARNTVGLALVILITDANGTLEEGLNKFEKSIGLYTEPDTTDYEEPPFYIPPIESDSTEVEWRA